MIKNPNFIKNEIHFLIILSQTVNTKSHKKKIVKYLKIDHYYLSFHQKGFNRIKMILTMPSSEKIVLKTAFINCEHKGISFYLRSI